MSTILEIPVRNDLDAYSFTIELDGVNYLLRFRYNDRSGLWYMSIAGTDGADILSGIPVQTNCSLIGRFPYAALPPGSFLAYDEAGGAANPTRDNFGDTVKMLYRTVT